MHLCNEEDDSTSKRNLTVSYVRALIISYLRHVIKIERVFVHCKAHNYRMQQQLVTMVGVKEE